MMACWRAVQPGARLCRGRLDHCGGHLEFRPGRAAHTSRLTDCSDGGIGGPGLFLRCGIHHSRRACDWGGAAKTSQPWTTKAARPGTWHLPTCAVTLQAYPLQGKFFEPQMMVYPAPAYAAVSQGAANSIQRLQTILGSPSPSLSNDALPALPWANAAQIIGAQPVVIPFNGGNGVRALAEYAQYIAPINNQELFYHFEGLSSDGQVLCRRDSAGEYGILAGRPAIRMRRSRPMGSRSRGSAIPTPPPGPAYYQTATNRLSTTTPEIIPAIPGGSGRAYWQFVRITIRRRNALLSPARPDPA